MKNLEFNVIGLSQLNEDELENVNGGILMELLVGMATLTLFAGDLAEEFGRSLAASKCR